MSEQLTGFQQFLQTQKNTKEAVAIARESAVTLGNLYLLLFLLTSLAVFPITHYRIGWRPVALSFVSAVVLNAVSLMFSGGYAGMLVQIWSLILVAAFLAQIAAVLRRIVVPPEHSIVCTGFGELTPPLWRWLDKASRGLVNRPHLDLIVIEPALMLCFSLVVWLAELWDRFEGAEAPGGAWIVPLVSAIGICLLGVQHLSEERKARAEHAEQVLQQE